MLDVSINPIDPALVVPSVTLSFAAVSLYFTCRAVICPAGSHSIKLIGTLLVITLALAANTPFLYGLTIFIVATLVTELGFLEKIAALVWNRGKFWDWMIARESSSEAEARIAERARGEMEASSTNENVVEDVAIDADANQATVANEQALPNDAHANQASGTLPPSSQRIPTRPPPSVADVNQYVSIAVGFERTVQQVLRGPKNPFIGTTAKSNLRISSTSASSSVEVDTILEGRNVDYIVEIKYAKNPHLLLTAARHAMRAAEAYRAYLRERNTPKDVIAILIIPADVSAPSTIDGIVPVLRFDASRGDFVDINDSMLTLASMRSYGQ